MLRKNTKKKKSSSTNNQLRIIGGQWRGRKLSFTNGDGLRPTMDRVRETLFNWLQADIVDAHCLDLFTGSGALAFEALSRQAANVTMLDNNPHAIRMIKDNLQLLSINNAKILQADTLSYLKNYQKTSKKSQFNIVFLDPPFNQGLIEPCCHLLNQANCLADCAKIYIESEKINSLKNLPENWTIIKEKKAGQLSFFLIQTE